MTPTDAALDDLHEEQQRRARMLRSMVSALRSLNYADPLIPERRAAYQMADIPREYYEHLDWTAVKQFNEERGNG